MPCSRMGKEVLSGNAMQAEQLKGVPGTAHCKGCLLFPLSWPGPGALLQCCGWSAGPVRSASSGAPALGAWIQQAVRPFGGQVPHCGLLVMPQAEHGLLKGRWAAVNRWPQAIKMPPVRKLQPFSRVVSLLCVPCLCRAVCLRLLSSVSCSEVVLVRGQGVEWGDHLGNCLDTLLTTVPLSLGSFLFPCHSQRLCWESALGRI